MNDESNTSLQNARTGAEIFAEGDRQSIGIAVAVALLVRQIDGGTASRAVPGSIGRAFLKSVDVVSSIGLGGTALTVAKEIFEGLGPLSPTPPDGGIESNVVSFIDACLRKAAACTEGPEAKAA